MIGELYDGGYWLVVPVVTDSDGGKSVGDIPDVGHNIFYGADFGIHHDLAAIRTPNPVDVPQAIEGFTVADLMQEAGISTVPFGRIGGV